MKTNRERIVRDLRLRAELRRPRFVFLTACLEALDSALSSPLVACFSNARSLSEIPGEGCVARYWREVDRKHGATYRWATKTPAEILADLDKLLLDIERDEYRLSNLPDNFDPAKAYEEYYGRPMLLPLPRSFDQEAHDWIYGQSPVIID